MRILRALSVSLFLLTLSATPAPRGWLGFTYFYRISVSAPHYGFLLVADVARNGPAARAGLAPHDVVIAINHKPLTYTSDAAAMAGISSVRVAQRIVFTVLRANARRDLTVIAAVMPEDEQRLWKKTLDGAATKPKTH